MYKRIINSISSKDELTAHNFPQSFVFKFTSLKSHYVAKLTVGKRVRASPKATSCIPSLVGKCAELYVAQFRTVCPFPEWKNAQDLLSNQLFLEECVCTC